MDPGMSIDFFKIIDFILPAAESPASKDAIDFFEEKNKITLPDSYKTFLAHCNGGYMDYDIGFECYFEYTFNNAATEYCVEQFSPLFCNEKFASLSVDEDISIALNMPDDEGQRIFHINDFFPFGRAGSCPLCMGHSKEFYGKIYLFNIWCASKNSVYESFHFLAGSFIEFIAKKIKSFRPESNDVDTLSFLQKKYLLSVNAS
jgi:hypothetical protein